MKHLSVLILDDDDFILDVTQAMLENMGVGYIEAHLSARSALKALDMSNPLQIILCDLNMPEMDGVEVIRYLGQQGFIGSVVVLSGEDLRTQHSVVTMGRAHHLNLLGSLNKPINPDELLAMLENITESVSKKPYALTLLSVEELQVGLETNAVVPYFQPQVDTVTGKVTGVEALARWQHKQLGIIGPAAFITVAEDHGLITILTHQMITQSFKQWRLWRDEGIDLSLSINVSMHSLNDFSFPDWLVAEAQAFDVPLDRLVMELTESHLSDNTLVTSDVLTRLCLKRIRLSVDDFGTAYSNMEKLQQLPFGELKIDKAFVHGAGHSPHSHSILKYSIELAKSLNMITVAEGVENQADWDCVIKQGCDLVQGYFIARPMPGDQIVPWVKQRGIAILGYPLKLGQSIVSIK